MTVSGARSEGDGPSGAAPDGNALAGDGRNESADERADRNWTEILQELRVTQTGTQIISGFLLTIAFQQRFKELDGYQIAVYLVLVFLAATSTALGLAPVSLHRTLFHRHEKSRMVVIGSRLLVATLWVVSILASGVVLLIFDVVIGRAVGVIAGIATGVVLVVMLVVLPWRARKGSSSSSN